MNNTRIGNKEAIALLVTITFNLIILNVTKSIINLTSSASLLNILYISIIVICYTCLICYFLKKFPTFDIIDISDYLGGNILKWIIGIAYIIYFVFWSGILLHLFSSFLQIIYFPMSKPFYIILIFLISAVLSCSMKHNAIYRSIFIFFPFLIVSTLILFLADIPYYEVEKIYPIFGNGLFTTFISGLANIFAFQTLAYIYFMPPILKKPEDIKKVSVTAIILSAIFFFNENGLDKTTEFHMKSSILRLVFLSNFNNSRSIFFYHYKKRVFLHNKKVLKSKRNQYLLRYSNKDAA